MSDVDRIAASVEKLNGRNYHAWRFQIEMICRARELREVVEYDEITRPVKGSTEHVEWVKKGSKALALMTLSTVQHIQAGLRGITTSKEIIAKFDREFRNKGLANRLRLRRKFVTMTAPAGMSMEEHLSKLSAMADELNAIGADVPDEELALTMLGSLPDTYATLITALDASQAMPSSEFVRIKILEEEERQKQLTGVEHGGSTALAAHGHNGHGHSGPGRNKKKSRSECYYCHKPGHFEKDCRKKKRDQKDTAAMAVDALLVVKQLDGPTPPLTFTCDSGATQHVVADRSMFSTYVEVRDTFIETADGTNLRVHGEGTVNLTTTNDNHITLTEVWHVPGIKFNLLSVRKAVALGHTVAFDGDGCVSSERQGLRTSVLLAREPTEDKATAMLWHERMGHMGISSMRLMAQRKLFKGMPEAFKDLPFCEACAEGKHQRSPFPTRTPTIPPTRPLELLHTDLMGPIHPPSISGARYLMVVVDDWTRLTWSFPLVNKTEVTPALKQWISLAKTAQPKNPIAYLRTDNGTEYVNGAMQAMLIEHGISHQTTTPYSPESNGLAERTNRTLSEMTRAMLHGRKLDLRLWAEAIQTATHLKNRAPSSALPGHITPFERYSSCASEVMNLRVFGSPAWVHQPKEKRDGKWAVRSAKHLFLGYEHRGAYRLWDAARGTAVRSPDVLFDEQALGASNRPQLTVEVEGELVPFQAGPGEMPTPRAAPARPSRSGPTPGIAVEVTAHSSAADKAAMPTDSPATAALPADRPSEQRESAAAEQPALPPAPASAPAPTPPGAPAASAPRVSTSAARMEPSRGQRRSARLARGEGDAALTMVNPEEVDTPRTVSEALSSPHAAKFLLHGGVPLAGLEEMGTWRVVERPKDANIVSCKWVFKVKMNPDGSISKHKARLVARGFTQQKGIDYEEVFAHTARIGLMRLVVALCCLFNLELHQIDFVAAYLNGTNKFKLFMEAPETMEIGQNQCLLMLKTLYGFKHSAHEWNGEIVNFLASIGFLRLLSDASVFVRVRDHTMVIMVVYVDDMLVAATKGTQMDEIKRELSSKFKATDLGEAHHILGIRITRDRSSGRLALDQERYAEEVLERFGMKSAKGTLTPMESKTRLTKATAEADKELTAHYRAIVGSLQYLAQGTRPDLCYTMSVLGQFCANPDETHLPAAKRALRYLRHTAAAQLVYSAVDHLEVEAYCDANYAADHDDRRSITGYLFKIADGAVYWNSRKQPTVALSTTEAEYMAAGAAGRQAVHIIALLKELGNDIKSMVINCDSQSAIAVTKHPVQHGRTKHIDVIHHWIKDKVADGILSFEYIDTAHQTADVLTKALAHAKHLKHAQAMGLQFK